MCVRVCGILSSTSNDSVIFSFPIWIHFISFFFFFFGLIAVTSTSSTMLNKSGESGHPCLVPSLRGNVFIFSPLMRFAVGLPYIVFIMLRFVPSIHSFLIIFVINRCRILSEVFPAYII